MRGITSHKTSWILSLLNEHNCWYATIAVWFYFGERKIINIPIVSMLGEFITAILQVNLWVWLYTWYKPDVNHGA